MNIINLALSAFISPIFCILSIINFSQQKIKIKSIVLYVLIMFPLFIIINLSFDGLLKFIFTLIISTIAVYISLFNKSFYNSLYYSIVYEIFVFIVEIILSIIFVSIFNFNLNSYNSFSWSLLLFSLLDCVSVLLISMIKPLSMLISKINKVINKQRYVIIYIIIILIMLTLLLFFNKANLENNLSFYINIGMTIFVFITSIYIISKDFQHEKLENQYSEMMEYVSRYEKIINDQGKKNHEYNNQLMVIKGYVDNPKKLEEYLNLIIDEHKCGQNYTIRQLSNFPDGGIKGLIYHKLSKMEENNIKYSLYIDKSSKNIFEEKFDIKTYQDITKLLGVFLDNAIEATIQAQEKEIDIDIKSEDDCIILTISNTYNKDIDLKQVGKRGFTTKGVGHGYGLSIVKDITKHNDNIETFKDLDEDKFKQTAIIYYKK